MAQQVQPFPGMQQQVGYQAPVAQTVPVYQQPAPGVMMVTAQPMPAPTRGPIAKSFRDVPQRMQCPNCDADVVTVMTFVPGVNTIIVAVIIAALGGVFGCCVVPFFMDSCKDVLHHCPNCRTKLGRYSKM